MLLFLQTMKLAEIVGQNIVMRRKELRLNHKELALQLGITQDALNRMEKDHIAPKLSRFEDLSRHLGCPVSSFFHSPGTGPQDRATAIADMLAPLSEELQESILKIVGEIIHSIKNKWKAPQELCPPSRKPQYGQRDREGGRMPWGGGGRHAWNGL